MLDNLLALVRNELRRIWCYRWWVAATTVALWAVAAIYVLQLPKTYDAWGQIYVNPQTPLTAAAREVSLVGENYGSPGVILSTFLNDDNLEQIARSLSADGPASPGEIEAKVSALRGAIRLVPDGGDGFIEVHVTDADPAQARETARIVIAQIISRASERNRSDLDRATRFLDERIEAQGRALLASQERLRAFRVSHPEVVQAPAAGLTAVAAPVGLSPRAPSPSTRGAAERYAAASARVAELEGRLAGLTANYTEAHPDVVAARRQLAEAASGLNALPAPRQVIQSIPRSAFTRPARPRIPTPEVASAWADLQKQDEVVQRFHQELLSKRTAAEMSQAIYNADTGKYLVTREPRRPIAPAGPDRRLYLFAGLLLGVAGGLGAGYLRAATKGVFVSSRELEQALQLPVIGAVSWEPAWRTGPPAHHQSRRPVTITGGSDGGSSRLERLRRAFQINHA